jgi:DNA-binding NarL/FixJ family response regulator
MNKIRLLLVDDQVLFIESLKKLLEITVKDIQVVGIAPNGKVALEMTASENPDIILMDIRMPEMDGVKSTQLIKEKFPQVKILILSTFEDDDYVMEAFKYGAVGYLLKDVPPNDLIAAIRSIDRGGVTVSPKMATKLAEKLFQTNQGMKPSPNSVNSHPWVRELSNKEKDILSLLAKGYNNREIAQRLYIAEQTVKNYVSIIYLKIGARDRVQAARIASEAGLDNY